MEPKGEWIFEKSSAKTFPGDHIWSPSFESEGIVEN